MFLNISYTLIIQFNSPGVPGELGFSVTGATVATVVVVVVVVDGAGVVSLAPL